MYNCCYQSSGPTVDEYGLQETSEAWMEHNEKSFDGTECYCDKSAREVARELCIQEEINGQKYYLANGGENDVPGAFVLDPEYPVFRPLCPEMSPDDPEYEEPLVQPPMRGWELHPPNMKFWVTWKNHTYC
jgi:hypothetical protein